jgi:hypothetical protein
MDRAEAGNQSDVRYFNELNPGSWTVVERISRKSHPVLNRTQTVELQLDPIMIAV